MQRLPTRAKPKGPASLQRNLQRRRLGGVCAGLADYLGIGPLPVRFLFLLSVFVSFSLTLWVYLALWLLLPSRPHVPIPEVPRPLRRRLKAMEKQVRKGHRRLEPRLADLVQDTFDAIKLLAPTLPAGSGNAQENLRNMCLEEFPALLDSLLRLPAGAAALDPVLDRLADLHHTLQEAATAMLQQDIGAAWQQADGISPLWARWKVRLDELKSRLDHRVSGEILDLLHNIEEKLAFLANRSEGQTKAFDLDPFHVSKIAEEYLPDAVEQYLKLPPAMARTQALPGGKTAEQALQEQLNLLDTALLDLSRSLYERNAGALMIHGHFLREKFADQSFRIPE